ncbi:MAG: 3-hydroxyacyl-CoA dehydrogenase NAD-binding domain-containing protein [Candidatus Binatia bacterium]
MGNFSYEIVDDVAWVVFDSGRMNTLTGAAIEELAAIEAELRLANNDAALAGVILKGNRFGLGAGADIGELLKGGREELESMIDRGHELFFAIEEGPLRWLALIDGVALGGIYELALACDGIVATARSIVGFPEIKLNIFPGLGGTQRLSRRCGLINASDPAGGDAAFGAVLQGKNYKAGKAAAANMIDAVVPEGEDPDGFARAFLVDSLPGLVREPPSDLENAEALRPMVLPMIERATLGRANPRAPYVALDLMIKGACLPLRDAIRLERDAFVEVAASAEGKAGMRFFFTQQSVQKLPRGFAGKARELKRIGVDGADGFMGNAIAWLALEAGYEVVGHVPLAEFASSVPEKLSAKYQRALKKGGLSEEQVADKVASVEVSSELSSLFDCDLVVEARTENRDIKASFYRELGAGLKKGALVASNSSSMGPGLLGAYFAEGGGEGANFLNLHFFSPAENPRMQLVELIRGERSSDDAVATAHAFVRRIGKTPVVLNDGSAGFLVNAGIAAYFEAAEELYREGSPISAIDNAIRASLLPMGPFELGDMAGLDISAGMMDTINAETPLEREPLVWKMRDAGRLGIKTGGGFYQYEDGKRVGEWAGLDALVPDRGDRAASDTEIVERCARALHDVASSLVDRGIAASREEADLCFVLGIGFAMHLGGPLFYGAQQGWS